MTLSVKTLKHVARKNTLSPLSKDSHGFGKLTQDGFISLELP